MAVSRMSSHPASRSKFFQEFRQLALDTRAVLVYSVDDAIGQVGTPYGKKRTANESSRGHQVPPGPTCPGARAPRLFSVKGAPCSSSRGGLLQGAAYRPITALCVCQSILPVRRSSRGRFREVRGPIPGGPGHSPWGRQRAPRRSPPHRDFFRRQWQEESGERRAQRQTESRAAGSEPTRWDGAFPVSGGGRSIRPGRISGVKPLGLNFRET